MRILITALLCLLLLPAVAAAQDMTALYQYYDGTKSRLYARGHDAYRMATDKDSYMLVIGGKTYLCRKTENGWRSTDVHSLMRSHGGGSQAMQQTPARVDVRFRSMHRTERIAGYTGRVYELSIYENGKLTRRDEVVMSTHSDVVGLSRAWAEMSSAMAGSTANDAASMQSVALLEDTKRYGGILRYGDEMRLRELKLKALPVDFFDLPPQEEQWSNQPSTEPVTPEPDEPKSDAERIGETVNKIIDLFGNQ